MYFVALKPNDLASIKDKPAERKGFNNLCLCFCFALLKESA
jgi:hypothetical protein